MPRLKNLALLIFVLVLPEVPFTVFAQSNNTATDSTANSLSPEKRKILERKVLDLQKKRASKLSQSQYREASALSWQLGETYELLKLSGLSAEAYQSGVRAAQKSRNKELEAQAYERLGRFYPKYKFYNKHKDNFLKARALYAQAKNAEGYKRSSLHLGKTAYAMKDYIFADEVLTDVLDNSESIDLSRSEKELIYDKLLLIHRKQSNTQNIKLYENLLADLRAGNDTTDNKKVLAKEYEALRKIDTAMLSQKDMIVWKEKADILRRKLSVTEEENREQKAKINEQQEKILEKERALLQNEVKLQEEKLQKDFLEKESRLNAEKSKRNFWGGVIILAIVLGASGIIILVKNNSNKKLSQKNHEIQQEREKSDMLLLNILPEQTAAELKEKGFATPRSYELVTVLFTDFKGFTSLSEKLEPEQIIEELNHCFQRFDEIVEKHGLEKIKTIGDAYMCAGGIPGENTCNPENAVRAGLEMQAFMKDWKLRKLAKSEAVFELRLGIHTGPVVAGVIGKKKFAYDIWGDTVNLAARMESSGQVGKVNISQTTYELIKGKFDCTHRGKVKAKNKGEIDMYFAERELPKPALS